ncbi:MAG: RNA polymerase sigma factor [Bacteroidales bacterium]|nr:RNA polymerase sigma factor [Bacteroidales bacterium]
MGNRRPKSTGPATDATSPASTDDPLLNTFNALRDELVSTLVYLLGNRDDALDATQEAFLKCWRNRESVPDIQNLRAWIFRVAMNHARDVRRSAWSRRVKPLVGEEQMFMTHDPVPGQQLEDRETLDRLRVAIAELRPEEQEVFLLRQNGELTYEQIAEVRQAPVGTVKTQMRSALMKLRKVMGSSECETRNAD